MRAPMPKPGWKKRILLGVGWVSVGLGTLGVFLPVLPTTPFLLLAAACFARSSERLYDWLLNHRWFGSTIRNYRERKGISLRTRIGALLLLWSTIGISVLFAMEAWWLRGVVCAIALGVSIHLLKMKTILNGKGKRG